MRNRLLLVLFVVFEAAALVVAWTRIPVPDPVDWGNPAGWLTRNDPDAVLLAVGRLLAIGLAAWLLCSTLAAVVARLALSTPRLPHRLRAVARAAGRVAPGVVRHVVEGAIAVSLVTAATGGRAASAATSAAPYAPAPAPQARPRVVPLGPVRDGHLTAPTAPPAPSPARASAPPVLPPGDRHLVVTGESLWTIAGDHLRALGLPADDLAVDRYWRGLCEANRKTLTSGDVNLLHPGDDLDLPPVA